MNQAVAKQAPAIKYWNVQDSRAPHNKTRMHEIVIEMRKGADGVLVPFKTQKYELSADKKTKMPKDHAMKFLTDPSFIVYDADGEVVMPITTKKEAELGINLPPNQIIVEVKELTTESLYRRAKVFPGGEDITEDDGSPEYRQSLIEFIIEANERAHPVGRGRGSEGTIREDTKTANELLG